MESRDLKSICTPVFIAALLTVAKTGMQSTCPWVDERISGTLSGVFVSVKGILPQLQQGWPLRTSAKRNKPVAERQ